ncbi:MAG TPA: hypothetical protein VLB79_00950 [Solirubrobacterales bacterium]|nr:hypothetical protein [Solirubrobacterales bacterium]
MVLLPRLARRLNSPAIATLLAVVLLVVGIVGIVTDDIPTRWAIVVAIVGLINLIRAIPYGRSDPDRA